MAPMKRDKTIVSVSDIVFTVAVVAAALLVWFLLVSGSAGQSVVIRMDGKIIAELPLNADAEFSAEGSYTNVFKISGGSVRVEHTDCPSGQCARAGAISAPGASLVCAPNHVSATVTGGGGVDALTG